MIEITSIIFVCVILILIICFLLLLLSHTYDREDRLKTINENQTKRITDLLIEINKLK